MSGHLVIVVGYLDLPLSHKLALMKICDSADDQTRLGYPGLDAVRLWAGVQRSRAFDVIKDLQAWGYLMQVTAGHRGSRATFKVFPDAGDERESLAAKRSEPCPGVDLFKGVPPIPSADEVKARAADVEVRRGPWNGSGAPDPNGKGPTPRTQSKGSAGSDPNEGERVQSAPVKGPVEDPKGSGGLDPFSTNLQEDQLHFCVADAPPDLPSPAKQAHRIPEDFATHITPGMVAWARKECPHVEGRTETEKFVDFWAAEAGQRARKHDWVRAWKVWFRKAESDSTRSYRTRTARSGTNSANSAALPEGW